MHWLLIAAPAVIAVVVVYCFPSKPRTRNANEMAHAEYERRMNHWG